MPKKTAIDEKLQRSDIRADPDSGLVLTGVPRDLTFIAGATTSYEFTSQCFFSESLTSAVHASSDYNTRGQRNTLNTNEGIYNGLSATERAALTLTATPMATGFSGAITLGVRVG